MLIKVPVWGLETIWKDDQAVGYLRRGDYAYTLGTSLGQGYIHHPEGRRVTEEFLNSGQYEVEVMGKRFKANVHLKSPFDPQRKRLKGQYDYPIHKPEGEIPPAREEVKERLIEIARGRLEGAAVRRGTGQKPSAKPYEVGDQVLLKEAPVSDFWSRETKKLFLPYSGPFEIIGIRRSNAYVLFDPGIQQARGVFNSESLKPWKPDRKNMRGEWVDATTCISGLIKTVSVRRCRTKTVWGHLKGPVMPVLGSKKKYISCPY
uniref:Aminomethyltransferase C-terminal domain-containing protein n=1 Tax=Timema shepardi TaxID=629360 RepID=A0A7R9AY81_TIMSH|nr:unnamed protein product [Timema shepardi]